MTPEDLCKLLQQLFQPDTQIIQDATAKLKIYFREIEALENLLILMSSHENQQVRQISCVYLRKIICKLWMNLQKDQQLTTKNLLLQRFREEPVTLVKKNIADVIGSIGRILIPNKEWPELFQFIFVSTQSQVLVEKELAMILLSVIIEYFSHDEIKLYYDSLNPIIEGYLQSDIQSLKSLSIETVNKLACTPKAVQVLKKYNNLIPLVLNALDLNQEDLISKVFETFNEFVEIKKVLGPHLPLIIEKALLISANQEYSVNLREQTLLFLELIPDKYARVLIKKFGINFVNKIVEDGFKIASEDPQQYEGANQYDTPPQMAIQMLYAWSSNVPTERIYPIFKIYLQKFGTSQNQYERAAATYILGNIADPNSCLDLIRDDINSMSNFLVDRMQDPSYVVREAAGEAVGRFSENVGLDFLNKHKEIMPCLLKVIKDLSISKHDMTVQKALFALNEFVQNLDYEIKFYLNDIIDLLLNFLQISHFSRDVHYWVLYALSSTINIAQKKIIPHMQKLLEAFHQIIIHQGDNSYLQQVKGQALMCAGRLASACGKDSFPTQAIEVFTQFGLVCLNQQTDSKLELRETAFTYFADLAILIREEMAPIFPQVIQEILKICNSENEFIEQKQKKDKDTGFSLDSDSDDGSLQGVDVDLNHLDEKASAVNALGVLCMYCPQLCQSKTKEILDSLENLQFYFHENIKFHVCLAYIQIASGLMRMNGKLNQDDKFEWKKGSPQESLLPQQVSDFLNQVMIPYYFKLFDDEDNKEVIERALENIIEVAEDFGPNAFSQCMDKLVNYLILFLKKETYCQTGVLKEDENEQLEDENDEDADDKDDDEEQSEENDDGIDHDEIIFGSVTEIVFQLARTLGNDFSPYFNILAPHIVVYTSDKHPKSDKNMALGCLAETFAAAPAVIPVYFNDYLQLLYKNSDTQDSKLNRNIAYSVGILAEHAPLLFQSHLQNSLSLLQKLHSNSSQLEAQDNIVSAFCRIVEFQLMPLPAQTRPSDYNQLIDQIFQKIPFEGDETENKTILKFAFKLYQNDEELCVKYMDKIAETCFKVIVDEKTADGVESQFKYQTGQFIQQVVIRFAQHKLQALEQLLDQDQKKQLEKYMLQQSQI